MIPDQNGQGVFLFSDQKGPQTIPFGAAHTSMAYIREYTPLPRFEAKSSNTMTVPLPCPLNSKLGHFLYPTGSLNSSTALLGEGWGGKASTKCPKGPLGQSASKTFSLHNCSKGSCQKRRTKGNWSALSFADSKLCARWM